MRTLRVAWNKQVLPIMTLCINMLAQALRSRTKHLPGSLLMHCQARRSLAEVVVLLEPN